MSLSNAALDGPVPLLRGCDAAYLDLGTNRGLKIEELLEARPGGFLRLFPPAYRGAANRPCALGAEPNPSHAAHLRTIEDAQRAAGRRVTILNAAISNANGEATFWSDLDEQAHEWGSSLLRWNRGMSPRNSSRVRTVSLDWLLRTHLLPAAPRFVVAKVDIEGAEYDAVPPAIEALCQGVDVLLLEMHARFFKERWRGHRPGFSTNISHVEHLIGLLKELPSRRQAGSCRTKVQWLATAEKEHAYLSKPRPRARLKAAGKAAGKAAAKAAPRASRLAAHGRSR